MSAKYAWHQRLWVKLDATYRVTDGDALVNYARSIGTLGKLAARLRRIGPDKFWAKLPDLPTEIRESIEAVAAHQDGFAVGQNTVDDIGRWDD
jgi:hypothetical protein